MSTQDLMSINTVAAKLGLSVHQLRRWELMFGLDIKRGRGQQRQYRQEDLTVLERIKELVEQGWPTSQIRPQIEAEGLITPRLIGVPQQPGNPEVVLESIIGFRNFSERRFIELSKQIDELRQLVISITLKQELAGESGSPWQAQPVEKEPEEVKIAPMVVEEPEPERPVEEITIGPEVAVSTDMQTKPQAPQTPVIPPEPSEPDVVPHAPSAPPVEEEKVEEPSVESVQEPEQESQAAQTPAPPAPVVKAAEPAKEQAVHIDEVTDQNYLTVLGKALDLIGWTDEQADEYAETTFSVPHWDELGRSHAEKMVAHLKTLLNPGAQESASEPVAKAPEPSSPEPAPEPEPEPEPEPTPEPTPEPEPAPAPEPVQEAAPPPAAPPPPPPAPEPSPAPEAGIMSSPQPQPTQEPEVHQSAATQLKAEAGLANPAQSVPDPAQPAVQPQAVAGDGAESPKPTITPVNWNTGEEKPSQAAPDENATNEEQSDQQQSFDPNQPG